MIKQNEHKTIIKGSKKLILSEFGTLVHALYEDNIFTKEELEEYFKLGLQSEEELEERINKKIQQLLNKLGGE